MFRRAASSSGAGEVRVELRRAHERERIGTRGLAHRNAELEPHDLAHRVIPHRLRVAQELLALRGQGAEVHAGERDERVDVPARDADAIRERHLALEPLPAHRRELLRDERGARALEHEALRAVRGVRDVDGRLLVGHARAVGEHDHRLRFPRDLPLVHRRELAAHEAVHLPVEEEPSATLRLAPLRRRRERVAHERERVIPQHVRVPRVDRAEDGIGLEPRPALVELARERDAHRLAVGAQPVDREGLGHDASRSDNSARTDAAATRSCFSVSRSRIVTVPSCTESPSTVMHHGVPTSSCRRYRRPIAPDSS